MGYYVELKIPHLTSLSKDTAANHILRNFVGPRLQPPAIHAIASTFIRLTVGALVYYEMARTIYEGYWKQTASAVAAVNASTHLESCLSDINRARRCMNKIRARLDVPQSLKSALPNRLKFIEAAAATKMKGIRDEIQHVEEHILEGLIPLDENTPIALFATGSEQLSGDDTVKVIDRLQIGKQVLSFSELADWLTEMAHCAESIAKLTP